MANDVIKGSVRYLGIFPMAAIRYNNHNETKRVTADIIGIGYKKAMPRVTATIRKPLDMTQKILSDIFRLANNATKPKTMTIEIVRYRRLNPVCPAADSPNGATCDCGLDCTYVYSGAFRMNMTWAITAIMNMKIVGTTTPVMNGRCDN
jgi:hypothetical protein